VERFLARFAESAYLVLRVGVAFLFIFHAPQKWLGWFGGPAFPLASIRSVASLIEVIASPLIALGLFTSYAALAAAAEMVAAYYVVHWPRPGWPIENRGELAVLYFLVFVYIAARGGGRYSLDRLLRNKG
jgi:putative oxidoreductase